MMRSLFQPILHSTNLFSSLHDSPFGTAEPAGKWITKSASLRSDRSKLPTSRQRIPETTKRGNEIVGRRSRSVSTMLSVDGMTTGDAGLGSSVAVVGATSALSDEGSLGGRSVLNRPNLG